MGVIAVGGYALDQWTKQLAITRLDPLHPPTFLGGFFRLLLLRNAGAAFSMGTSATIAFSLLAVVALLGVLVAVVPRVRRWPSAIATGMVLAGIAGNLTDRLIRSPGPLRGQVIDFLSFPHFAVFNVADMFITCTAILVIGMSLFPARPRSEGSARTSPVRK